MWSICYEAHSYTYTASFVPRPESYHCLIPSNPIHESQFPCYFQSGYIPNIIILGGRHARRPIFSITCYPFLSPLDDAHVTANCCNCHIDRRISLSSSCLPQFVVNVMIVAITNSIYNRKGRRPQVLGLRII